MSVSETFHNTSSVGEQLSSSSTHLAEWRAGIKEKSLNLQKSKKCCWQAVKTNHRVIFESFCDSKMCMCAFGVLVLNVLFAQPISPAGCINNYSRTHMMHKLLQHTLIRLGGVKGGRGVGVWRGMNQCHCINASPTL